MKRDQRRNVDQHAGGPAGGRLKRLLCRARAGPLPPRRSPATPPPPDRWCLPSAPPAPSSSREQDQDQLTGEYRRPPVDRRRFAAQEEDLAEMLLDQPGGPRSCPRRPPRAGSRHRPAHALRTRLRRCGRCSCPTRPGCSCGRRACKQSGEQVVIAPPGAHLIQRHQEQVRRLYLLQQGLAAGAAGSRVPADPPTAAPAPRCPARTHAPARPAARAPPRPGNPEHGDGCGKLLRHEVGHIRLAAQPDKVGAGCSPAARSLQYVLPAPLPRHRARQRRRHHVAWPLPRRR